MTVVRGYKEGVGPPERAQHIHPSHSRRASIDIILDAGMAPSSEQASATPHPSDIYVRRLFKLGLGYPLWQAEASQDEVEIGDVGYLRQGRFYRLFNATKGWGDPPQLPSAFEPYKVGPILCCSLRTRVSEKPAER